MFSLKKKTTLSDVLLSKIEFITLTLRGPATQPSEPTIQQQRTLPVALEHMRLNSEFERGGNKVLVVKSVLL